MWDDIHDALRDQVRQAEGRDQQPSAAVLDSQSAKTACGGEQIGYDAGKKTRGRRRYLLVDTCGLLLVCVVHSAGVQDRAWARLVLGSIAEEYPGIGLVWADGGPPAAWTPPWSTGPTRNWGSGWRSSNAATI